MDVGIVGAPGSGRTTVFRALLAQRAPRAAGERHAAAVGGILVADPRLDALAERFQPRKSTPVELRILDLCPSLEASFPTAEIEAMKRADLLLLVIPSFAAPSPEAAAAAFGRLLEDLCLEDLAAVERRLARHPREKLAEPEREALEAARAALEAGRPLYAAPLGGRQRAELRSYALVTDRPLIALQNTAESEAGAPPAAALVARAGEHGVPVLALCAALEAEAAELEPGERAALLTEYGIAQPAAAAVTRAVLERADLITFFTLNEDECRAWALERGAVARRAAGKVHSDMERGFIRAEVIPADRLAVLEGGLQEARKRGLLRVEGRDYVVCDGDVLHVRFNV